MVFVGKKSVTKKRRVVKNTGSNSRTNKKRRVIFVGFFKFFLLFPFQSHYLIFS